MKYKHIVPIMFFVIIFTSCIKSTEPIGDNPPPPGYQEEISWPSLADSPWPMDHHDPQNTGRSELSGPSSGIITWEFGSANKLSSGIVVGPDSTLYFIQASPDSGLYAFNPNGTLKWKVGIGTNHMVWTSPIITADGTIFCYDGNRFVHAVDPSGFIKYSFTIPNVTRSKTFAIDKSGYFYYVDLYTTLYVIDQEGNIQWTLQDDRFSSFSSYLSFSPDGNTVYIVSSSPIVLAVDVNTKQVKWSFQGDDVPDVPNFQPANGVVVDSYGNIYFLTKRNFNEGEIFALYPNGEIKWRNRIHSQDIRVIPNVPTLDKFGNLYCAIDSVYSFDFEGKLRWKSALNNKSDCPTICDNLGSIYVGTFEISIISFDSDGNQLWQIDDNQNGVGGSPAIGFNEMMFFPTWESEKIYGIK